jgi:hypothetical protein
MFSLPQNALSGEVQVDRLSGTGPALAAFGGARTPLHQSGRGGGPARGHRQCSGRDGRERARGGQPHLRALCHARLGPLPNDAGLWLTATSYHRSLKRYPTPGGLSLPLLGPDEKPNRIMGGGPGADGVGGIYWFVEAINKRQLIEGA